MKEDNQNIYTLDKIFRITLSVTLFILLYFLLSYLKSVLIPFAIAALLAYLMKPLVFFFQYRLHFKYRIVSILSSLAFTLTIIVSLIKLIAPLINKEYILMESMIQTIAKDAEKNGELFSFLPDGVKEFIIELINREEIQSLFSSENFQKIILSAIQKIVPSIWGVFSSALDLFLWMFGLTIILLYLVFILLDYDKIMQGWKKLIPYKYRNTIIDIVENFRNGMSKYFRAQALIALIVGILFAIGFYSIGLPLGILLGLFIGILNLVPYLQIIAIFPATILVVLNTLQTGENFWGMMGLVLSVFAIIQLIQEAILSPKIMGSTTGLNPAIILLSLSIWGSLLGFLGLIIALPITILLLIYYQQYLQQGEKDNKHNLERP